MNIDDLIREVQDNQNKILDVVNKYDDIYARKWDQELKSLFKGKVISNWTDFAYDKSVSYTITLKTNKPFDSGLIDEQKREFWNVELYLSVVLPYYMAFVTHIKSEHKRIQLREEIAEPEDTKMKMYLRLAEEFAEEKGYTKIPLEYASVIVPNVELDLAEAGQATVYNCLFVDHYTS